MDILKKISEFKSSTEYKNMVTGERYFKNRTDILNRKFYYYPMSVRTVDPYRANNRIVNNFFRMLVEQKISFCLGKDVSIQNYIPMFDVNNFIDEVAEEACIKGKAWGHPYIDELKSLKVAMIPSEQIIPIYDYTIEKKLINVIRFYEMDSTEIIELWDSEKAIYYEKDIKNELIQTNEIMHNWGKVPFVPLYNNRYEINDLENIKELIDSFDKCVSDFANNFEDFQDIYYKIKNYAGSIEKNEDVANILEFLKQHKIVPVSADGDFEAIQLEIPYNARESYLNLVRDLIFLYGQGLDTDKLTGGSLTTTAIKSKIQNLEQKCNKFLKYVKKFIEELIYFDVKYKTIIGNSDTDISKLDIIFNITFLINTQEEVSNVMSSKELLSLETLLIHHPYVDDYKKELDRLNKEAIDNSLNESIQPEESIESIDTELSVEKQEN